MSGRLQRQSDGDDRFLGCCDGLQIGQKFDCFVGDIRYRGDRGDLLVMRQIWRWRLIAALAVVSPLLIIDAGSLAPNVAKFAQGGLVQAVVAIFIAFLMQTWISGRKLLSDRTKADDVPLDFLLGNFMKKQPTTVPGTAIFLTSEVEGAPSALIHSLKPAL